MKIVLFILPRKSFLPSEKENNVSIEERYSLVPLLIDPLIDVRTEYVAARINGWKTENGGQSPVEKISMDVSCQREKNVFHRGRNVFMGCARTSAHAKTAEQAWRSEKIKPATGFGSISWKPRRPASADKCTTRNQWWMEGVVAFAITTPESNSTPPPSSLSLFLFLLLLLFCHAFVSRSRLAKRFWQGRHQSVGDELRRFRTRRFSFHSRSIFRPLRIIYLYSWSVRVYPKTDN